MPAHKKNQEDLIIKQIHIWVNKTDYYKLKIICVEKDITINKFVRNLIKNAIE
ncbi:hypothetical protein [Spiroplasma endosymbiont of Nebria brevicollis]|uniref:hypothetical protein n=1 Tax=Spiroplasma endosymbiont of Nebria brevicollis TaxID=3066284 RepID=UPI00313B99D7